MEDLGNVSAMQDVRQRAGARRTGTAGLFPVYLDHLRLLWQRAGRARG
jgi:hypothetical protein